MIKKLIAILFAVSAFANMQMNPIPSRLQWFQNSGYCGEVCLISAGLYYGQYLSQYDVRALVSKDQTSGSVLLGVNDTEAAQKLHLKYEAFDFNSQKNTDQFLIWMKLKVANGNPVAMGIYANQTLFNTGSEGDSDYDHIASVSTVSSVHSVSDPTYYGMDLVGFSDNGLWDGTQDAPSFYFTYNFDPFQATRDNANLPNAPVYSLPICTQANNVTNYGMAITGVADLNGDTLPVRVTTDFNYENPSIGKKSNTRPQPMPITLTITVSNVEPLTPYNLYRYNSLDSVPESEFNGHASQASEKHSFEIRDGSTYTFTEMIQSDDVAVYRCVECNAP